jgi:hypothetical protein
MVMAKLLLGCGMHGYGYVGARFPYRGRARSSARRIERSRRAAICSP